MPSTIPFGSTTELYRQLVKQHNKLNKSKILIVPAKTITWGDIEAVITKYSEQLSKQNNQPTHDPLPLYTFTIELNALHEEIFSNYQKLLKLKRPEISFLTDDCFSPSGLDECCPVIENDLTSILNILNQLGAKKNFESDVLVIWFKLFNLFKRVGIPLEVDEEDNTIKANLNYEALLESLKLISHSDLNAYEAHTGKKTEIKTFQQEYIKYDSTQYYDHYYLSVNGSLILLPKVEDPSDIVFALMDKLLYESYRHKWNEEPCLSLRKCLEKYQPGAFKKSKEAFIKELKQAEHTRHTFFSEFDSEDSDDEEAITYRTLPAGEKERRDNKSRTLLSRITPAPAKYLEKMRVFSKPPALNRTKNPKIYRGNQFNRRSANADLNRINDKLKNGEALTEEFLNSLENQFVVAQYRGIHYVMTQWDTEARRMHREWNEIGLSQFSSSAFKAMNINSYRQYLEALANNPEFEKEITEKAETIQHKLQRMQHAPAVAYDGYAYVSPFHLLQYWYSENYNAYGERVAKRLESKDPLFYFYLLNEYRPFLSTSDLPLHALWYAYGIKLYKGHEHERLRPCYDKHLKAKRPYSGKVYVSLHPLSDYTDLFPSHLTSWFKHGLANLNNLIVAERETSFLGYLPADRTVYQYKAKYPSFRGKYKPFYLHKYGIDKPMYEAIQNGFKQHPPHSEQRRALKRLLGEYLCAFHEIRLIDKANEIAEANGKILIYRDEDGLFSLYHPDTPTTRNKRLNPIVMARRRLYEAIGDLNKGRIVKPVPQAAFESKTETHRKTLTANKSRDLASLPSQKADKFRFFGSKNETEVGHRKNEKSVSRIPLPTLNHR